MEFCSDALALDPATGGCCDVDALRYRWAAVNYHDILHAFRRFCNQHCAYKALAEFFSTRKGKTFLLHVYADEDSLWTSDVSDWMLHGPSVENEICYQVHQKQSVGLVPVFDDESLFEQIHVDDRNTQDCNPIFVNQWDAIDTKFLKRFVRPHTTDGTEETLFWRTGEEMHAYCAYKKRLYAELEDTTCTEWFEREEEIVYGDALQCHDKRKQTCLDEFLKRK